MFRALAASLLVLSLAGAQEPHTPLASTEERLVVAEMSRVRLHPKEYAAWLQTQVQYFNGFIWHLPDRVPIRTEEGPAALEELIAFLEQTPSVGPLHWSEGLAQTARQLVSEQGPTGQTGHKGPTGSTVQTRALAHGLYQSTMGEVINYGPETPRWTVVQLLIDDGVPARSHRKIIFEPGFHVAGAGIGPHAKYGEMTVVDLADGFMDNPKPK